jgi:hypothetical protein
MKIYKMEKTTKIILGIAFPLAIFGGYWFIVRNREPYLDLEDTDWINNIAKIKFGNNKKSVSLGNNGQMNAGATYSDKYKLEFTSDKKLMVFYIKDKDGSLIDKQTLDFGAKIRY